MPRDKAKIRKKRDFLLVVWHPGSIATSCLKLTCASQAIMEISQRNKMEKAGWEIRPAGWLVLFAVAAFLVWLIFQQSQAPSNKNPP